MNSLIEDRVEGETWEMDGTNADWAHVEPLQYAIPERGWALTQQVAPALIVLAWASLIAGRLACCWRHGGCDHERRMAQ